MPEDRGLRVLVVEDEAPVLRVLREQLTRAGFQVETRTTGEEGLEASLSGGFDMILLDVGLPGMSGLEMVVALRGEGDATPIIMVTGLGSEDDVVRGLEAGADGYITKPFSPRELVARMRALARRNHLADGTVLSVGDLVLDQGTQRVTRGGAPVRLTGTELRLLATLIKAKGQTVSKTELLKKIWGMDFDPETTVLEVHIANLRKKLNATGPPLITTIRGDGYCLRPDAQVLPP